VNKISIINRIRGRIYLTIIGGVFCAVVGGLVGSSILWLLAFIQDWPNSASSIGSMFIGFSAFLFFGTLMVAMFGLIAGLIGSWWLVARLSGEVTFKRVVFESAGMGAVLGIACLLVAISLQWALTTPFVMVLPIWMGTGIVCGVGLPLFFRKFKLVSKY